MIQFVRFENFRVLRRTSLPLGRFTLVVGPNGSGKSTALKALVAFRQSQAWQAEQVLSVEAEGSVGAEVFAVARSTEGEATAQASWVKGRPAQGLVFRRSGPNPAALEASLQRALYGVRLYTLNADAVAAQAQLQPELELGGDGRNLAVVLDRLRDVHPERFEALNAELGRWLPEFDRVLFETPAAGYRAIMLRTRTGRHIFKALDLSQGTLIALAIVTLAYLPSPPPLVCLEEPDHGLHPRLLRDVRDAIYRLAYPENFGENREPVQVIATTHNPYFLDLFRDHPEEIVIAERTGLEAKFSRLSDRADLNEILGEAHLGDVWYSGVLGGVPVGT